MEAFPLGKLTRLFFLLLSMLAGCTAFSSQMIELRTSTTFEISSKRFDAIELQPSEVQLYKGKKIVGFIMTIDTNPESESAMDEVKQGFVEANKGPGIPKVLNLPENAYGFSSTFQGYTTAFIAIEDHPEAWITVSVLDDVFEEILSSMVIK